ncbi:peptide ABC transporter substrate-binding protein [Ponticoccus alexandrii]|uniref:Peptide ABC transporter substrate-binding protein n=1 Tax=Ponticoccus alexandrii TaxID=1943633 RepID=A0ABX7FGI4_9RHOB|nr:peptide ABC transporter substrate-binding protein [Ponticoccus alexandrii]ETA49371.1 ABC transporter substrate-binding protein [Rhodobacteraceae bacterium PD-2]QRF69302.1 peptide ABC transporter substrate-binding protein [Ponticoccus alexandrii]
MTKDKSPKSGFTRRATLRMMTAGGAVGLLVPSILGKPAFAQTPPAEPTGRVVVGLSQEPTVFNPLMPHIETDDGVAFSIFDALFRIMPDGEIMPNLATEIPTVENGGLSEDGLNWRIKLRDDVTWHDGEPFTAEDVKFTLELITNPEFRAWRTAGHDLVRDIEVVSPTEITWRMEEPFAPYLSFLSETFILPKHILAGAEDPNDTPFNQAPVGTGAFKWGSRQAGDNLQLVANPDYHGDGPYIEQLVFKYIPDMTVLYTQFRSGEIDLVGQAYITPDNYEEAKTLDERVVELVPRGTLESIYLNQSLPVFQDKAVREALYLAIDRKSIIDLLYFGVPGEAETFMPETSAFYNPDLPEHEFDLEKATSLLDEAGWTPGADGIREKDGVRLSFANSTTTGAHLREQAQQFIQQTYAQIGVEMKIENLPPAVMWGEFWGQSQFESAMVGITYLIGADPDVTNRFHSKAIAAESGSGSNNARYSNPEVDRLLEEGARTFDIEKRKEIYKEIQAIIREDLPFLPLFRYTNVFGRKAGLEGFEPNSNTRTESSHAALWYWG